MKTFRLLVLVAIIAWRHKALGAQPVQAQAKIIRSRRKPAVGQPVLNGTGMRNGADLAISSPQETHRRYGFPGPVCNPLTTRLLPTWA